MISAVVLAKNEEKNIHRCLSSLLWCDEIIIIDDYSEDQILSAVCRLPSAVRKKTKILKRHLKGDFAAQRNFGLRKAKCDWVLFVDADEEISDELAIEIKNKILKVKNKKHKLKIKNTNGMFIRRKDYFLGKWLKHGETANIKLLRLAKKNKGGWTGRVHEVWEVKGKVGDLERHILHYPHTSVSQFLKEINRYTDIVAQYWKEQKRTVSFFEIFLYPFGKFIQNYIIHLGFLDGIPGLIMAVMMSFHSFLTRGKLWQRTKINR